MEDKSKAIQENAQTIASEQTEKVTLPTKDDPEAQIRALEEEKARLIEKNANLEVGLLKERSKRRETLETDETEDERMRRIATETLADSRLAEIAREQQAIIDKALKENKELKLAQLNKTGVPASIGSSNESQSVRDTTITPDQMSAFKSRGWSDKDIERYKKNLNKYGGR